MTRTTRSSTQQPSTLSTLKSTKKRKRISDSNDQSQFPPTKQLRHSPPKILAGDSHINKEYAQKILDILEMYFYFFSFLLKFIQLSSSGSILKVYLIAYFLFQKIQILFHYELFLNNSINILSTFFVQLYNISFQSHLYPVQLNLQLQHNNSVFAL
jgi:hypothetical protein